MRFAEEVRGILSGASAFDQDLGNWDLSSIETDEGGMTGFFDNSGLSSGVYLYRLQAGSQIMTRKLTVVK